MFISGHMSVGVFHAAVFGQRRCDATRESRVKDEALWCERYLCNVSRQGKYCGGSKRDQKEREDKSRNQDKSDEMKTDFLLK